MGLICDLTCDLICELGEEFKDNIGVITGWRLGWGYIEVRMRVEWEWHGIVVIGKGEKFSFCDSEL